MMFPDRPLDHAGPGRPCATATVRMAFRHRDVVGARDEKTFAAQWLAYASPCRRFAADLAIDCARLGGRCGAHDLHRRGLSPHTPRRSPGAPLFSPCSRRRPPAHPPRDETLEG